MTTADAVRRVGLALPRAYEREIGGVWKLKVGPIVFVAFSRDEQDMGFGFPREEREALVSSAPHVFFMPSRGDLRYQWVCAHLAELDDQEMRELVIDAWRMCVPAMLHDLPDLPAPAAQVWDHLDVGDLAGARPLLHPQVRWRDGSVRLRGRNRVLAHLADHPRIRPPHEVEAREGRIYRWTR